MPNLTRVQAKVRKKRIVRGFQAVFTLVGLSLFVVGLYSPGTDQGLLAGGIAMLSIGLVVGDWLKEAIDDQFDIETATHSFTGDVDVSSTTNTTSTVTVTGKLKLP